MGISGLLSFLKSNDYNKPAAITRGNLREFRGKRAAIDAYCWLHKGLYSCADDLFMGKETTRYIDYCVRMIKVVQSKGITPILVFDGEQMPFKVVEKQRHDSRKSARLRANELIALGKMNEARQFMANSINVTHEMASKLIEKCHEMYIDAIVAPYEADSQLAYLELANYVDFIITEDSDLIVFGCKTIFFKIDINGDGDIYKKENLEVTVKSKTNIQRNLTFDKIRYALILSGCDYVKNLEGIGIHKGFKFMNMTEITEIRRFLPRVRSYLGLAVVVDDNYIRNFVMANFAFLYPIVFDPKLRKRVTLNDATFVENDEDYIEFRSLFNNTECDHFQLALGNIDNKSQIYNRFNPDDANFFSMYSNKFFMFKEEHVKTPDGHSYTKYKRTVPLKRKVQESKCIIEKDPMDLVRLYANIDIKKKADEPMAINEPVKKRIRSCIFSKTKLENNEEEENRNRTSQYFTGLPKKTDVLKPNTAESIETFVDNLFASEYSPINTEANIDFVKEVDSASIVSNTKKALTENIFARKAQIPQRNKTGSPKGRQQSITNFFKKLQ